MVKFGEKEEPPFRYVKYPPEERALPFRYEPKHAELAEETLKNIFIKELNDAIESEAKAIDDYNIIIGTCNDLISLHMDYNISEIRKIIEEIKTDETDHYKKLVEIRRILI